MFSYQLLPRAKTKHDAKEFKQGEDRTFSGGFGEREVRHAGNPSQERKKVLRKRIIVSGDTERKKNTSNLKSFSSPQRTGHFPLDFQIFMLSPSFPQGLCSFCSFIHYSLIQLLF